MTGTIMEVKPLNPIPSGKGILVTKDQQITKVLLWNQNFVEEKEHTNWTGTIEIPAANDSILNSVSATIGIGCGSPWESWQLMGRPLNPTTAQMELLKQHSEMSYSFSKLTVKNETFSLSFELKPGEVKYFEISKPGTSVNTRFVNAEEFKVWDKAMGEKSK
jgi:beta-xylosidase